MLTSSGSRAPSRHHYLPRFYLKRFSADEEPADSSAIFVYEANKRIRRSTPNAEGFSRDFYSFVDESGKNPHYENVLARLDADAACVIKEICELKPELPTGEQAEVLARFVGTMFTRVPAGRRLHDKFVEPFSKQKIREAM